MTYLGKTGMDNHNNLYINLQTCQLFGHWNSLQIKYNNVNPIFLSPSKPLIFLLDWTVDENGRYGRCSPPIIHF